MGYYEEKTRLNVNIPTKLYNYLVRDSSMYGVSKSSIVQAALTRYYRDEQSAVSSGKETPEGVDDTP